MQKQTHPRRSRRTRDQRDQRARITRAPEAIGCSAYRPQVARVTAANRSLTPGRGSSRHTPGSTASRAPLAANTSTVGGSEPQSRTRRASVTRPSAASRSTSHSESMLIQVRSGPRW